MKKLNSRERSCFTVVYQNLLLAGYGKSLIFNDGSLLLEFDNARYPAYTFFDYYQEYYKNTFIESSTVPHLICMAFGSITNLENLRYPDYVVDHLNEKGLEIFFYETVNLDIFKEEKQALLCPENLKRVGIDHEYERLKYVIAGFESTEENLENLYCFEFEKVLEFAKANRLTNITICTSEHDPEKYFKKQYPMFKFKTKDICMASFFKPTTNPKFTSYEYYDVVNVPSSETIEYKFWSGNRRYDGYRHLVAAYLNDRQSLVSYQQTLEDSIFQSYKLDKNPGVVWGNLEKYLWFDINKWKDTNPLVYQKLVKNLSQLKETNIDLDVRSPDGLDWNITPVDTYQKAFCAVVTEQKYSHPAATFSEKTLNAIKSYRPFILVAPPMTLEYLKKYGVKTFSNYWDESYDQETNHEKRLIKVFEVIDYLDSMSIDQLKNLYQSITPILEHNYKVIKTLIKGSPE